MQKAKLPDNESERIAALKKYQILETSSERAFDDIANLASLICGTPIALITLVDENRQWFKSKIGLSIDETPRDISFCSHTIIQEDIFEIPNTVQDERFFDNPLVLEHPNIRFYAGIPLISKDGLALGSLCVMDQKPNKLTTQQRESLKLLGQQVADLIEYRMTIIKIEEATELLEETGTMTKVGGWVLDLLDMQIQWTKEVFVIHELELNKPPTFDDAIEFFTLESQTILRATVDKAIKTATQWDLELQLITAKNNLIWVRTQGKAVQKNNKTVRLMGTIQNITDQKKYQSDLAWVNRALLILSKCNEALSHFKDETRLTREICRIIVDIGGYRMAWVGYAENDDYKSIKPKEYYGHSTKEFFKSIKLSWSENHVNGQGPGGRTIREAMPVVVDNLMLDQTYPVKTEARKHGYLSLISLPLKQKDKAFGLLAMYASEIRNFAEQEVSLLQELADNLAIGILNIRLEKERQLLNTAMIKLAKSINLVSGDAFFEKLLISMVDTVGAKAGFISRLVPGTVSKGEMLAVTINGNKIDNFDYIVSKELLSAMSNNSSLFIAPNDAYINFPDLSIMRFHDYQAFAALSLPNNVGENAGFMIVFFHDALSENAQNLIKTTLKIFSSRLASELERMESQKLIQEQASLIDKTRDPIVILDMDNRITFWNKGAEALYGWTYSEAYQKSINQLLKQDQNIFNKAKNELMQHDEWVGEITEYNKDGSMLIIEAHWTLVRNSDKTPRSIFSVKLDVTARKQAEIELTRLNRALVLRSAMAKLVNHATTENQLLKDACQLAVDIGGYNTSWIGYAEEDQIKSIKPMAISGKACEYVLNIRVSWSDKLSEGLGPAGRSMKSGAPVIIEDFSRDHNFLPWLDNAKLYGLAGIISLPLIDKTEIFGILNLYLSEPRTIASDEIILLEALAEDLSFGIKLLRAKEAQKRVLDAISSVAKCVSSNSDDLFFDQLNKNMSEALMADISFIARIVSNEPLKSSTVSAIAKGNKIDNFEYFIEDTPCKNIVLENEYLSFCDEHFLFPNSSVINNIFVSYFAGFKLVNSKGDLIGQICLLFSNPLKDIAYVSSTIKIFAARASAEIERQDSEIRIRQQASLLDKAQDAILVRGLDHQIKYWNKSAERMYGWSSSEALQCKVDTLLYDDPTEFYNATNKLLINGEWVGEIQQKRKDGSFMTIEGHWTLVLDEEGSPESILAINTDISLRKAALDEIQHLAFYDSLTLLPNKQFLIDQLKLAFKSASRHQYLSALLFIDLDNFKNLNDTLGHSYGDLLLKEVAIRLKSCVRTSDIVARFGGDEYVILVTELSSERNVACDQVQRIADKILLELNHPYQLEEHTYFSTPSVGIAIIDQSITNYEEILKQADLAMYQAKAFGRNTSRFYSNEMQTKVTNRVSLEKDLKKALINEEFLVYYQPQVNNLNQIEGAEALIRWKNPKRGMVSPIDFIPIAEETKLILPIGEWVLKTACKQLADWSNHDAFSNLTIAVNVSIQQFRDPSFVSKVLSIINETNANPKKLKLEITESMLVDNVQDIISKMLILKDAGVHFSLDDFGTGYSSLSFLKMLPIDQLKIDQSFVRDVLVDPNDASIAKAIINLAHSLGLNVIAEGVEIEEQRQFLLDNKCTTYQGYFFSRPISIHEFNKLLVR
jgi:diguanylate cyclase (GGDEF)-like protein/PAS domain S-box-containing protein